jgi:hypothetical protein
MKRNTAKFTNELLQLPSDNGVNTDEWVRIIKPTDQNEHPVWRLFQQSNFGEWLDLESFGRFRITCKLMLKCTRPSSLCPIGRFSVEQMVAITGRQTQETAYIQFGDFDKVSESEQYANIHKWLQYDFLNQKTQHVILKCKIHRAFYLSFPRQIVSVHVDGWFFGGLSQALKGANVKQLTTSNMSNDNRRDLTGLKEWTHILEPSDDFFNEFIVDRDMRFTLIVTRANVNPMLFNYLFNNLTCKHIHIQAWKLPVSEIVPHYLATKLDSLSLEASECCNHTLKQLALAFPHLRTLHVVTLDRMCFLDDPNWRANFSNMKKLHTWSFFDHRTSVTSDCD